MDKLKAVSILNRLRDNLLVRLPEINIGRYRVSYKSDGSPVTSSDKWVEEYVRAELLTACPDLQFLGEESFASETWELRPGTLAVLDPIDGTENFCSGLKEWGISLGIWRDGMHLSSLLLMPELGESLITGERPVKVRSRITGFSSSFDEGIVAGIRGSLEYRVTGCAVYNIYNVIRGAFARFINPKGAYVWDLLPGLMLALENGCEVLLDDEVYHGQLLDPTRKYRVDIRHRYDIYLG